jgi:uncharacterized protein YndB with AHSA1/START domain
MAVIERDIQIAAPVETVWRYLEDPDLLAGWLMRNDFRPERGARFHFFATPGGDWDGVIDSEVVEFDPPHKIAFTWNANNIGADTLVTIELTPNDGGTLLSLRHVNWAGAKGDIGEHIKRHGEGWDDHLNVLRKAAQESRSEDPAPPIDWTRFKLWVVIKAEPEEVFKAWATSGGMESFFVDAMQMRSPNGALRGADEIVRPGDNYVWRWDSGRIVQGKVLEVRVGREIDYTFDECKFRIHAHPYKGGTLLELEQYDMDDTPENRMHLHTNCRSAWVYFLTNLKSVHEHGRDVRDKARATGASFSTYFSPEAAGIALSEG